MISDTESSHTDSDNEINEIESMLYSQIHHSVEWSCEDEVTDIHAITYKKPNAKTSYVSEFKNSPCARSNHESIVNLSGRTMQIPLVNKENVKQTAIEDVIVLSSDDECKILDYCGIVSKYNYHGVKETSTKIHNNLDRSTSKSSIESDNSSTLVDSTTSLSGRTSVTNLYIHINDDEAQTNAEQLDVDLVSISSSDDDVQHVRKRKQEEVVTSLRKRQNTVGHPFQHSTVDEDCIIEIPVPVRKGDDWFISDGDRLQRAPNRRKDFRRRQLHIICHNCSRRGHISKTCPEPIKKINCYICGDSGHHGNQCFRATCSLCWETGHSSISCHQRKKIPYRKCTVCQVPGHLVEHCPDFWRRYHLTIIPGNLVAAKHLSKSRDAVFCCNCGKKGHHVHECSDKRMDIFVLPNRPDVVAYSGLLPTPSSSQMQIQNGSISKTFSAFGKHKRWKKNFKQESRQAMSSVKKKFRKHFRFTNISTPELDRNKCPVMGNLVNDVVQRQNTQQTAGCVTNTRQQRKKYWKNKFCQRYFS